MQPGNDSAVMTGTVTPPEDQAVQETAANDSSPLNDVSSMDGPNPDASDWAIVDIATNVVLNKIVATDEEATGWSDDTAYLYKLRPDYTIDIGDVWDPIQLYGNTDPIPPKTPDQPPKDPPRKDPIQ